jgi:5S rRNA maturation endonuclease (ribonuclease M5)
MLFKPYKTDKEKIKSISLDIDKLGESIKDELREALKSRSYYSKDSTKDKFVIVTPDISIEDVLNLEQEFVNSQAQFIMNSLRKLKNKEEEPEKESSSLSSSCEDVVQ